MLATVSLLAAGSSALQSPAQAVAQRQPGGKVAAVHRVTLISGDVVTVTTLAGGRQIADVDRPDDAVGGVGIQEIKGDLYVVPDEALALLGADRLDRRLFNVTDLIEMGYDDARAVRLPVIASFEAGAAAGEARGVTEPIAPSGSTLLRALPGIRGAALATEKRQARTFWNAIAPQRNQSALGAGVAKLWLDGRVKVNLKESVPQVGAPRAWAAGYDGKGVKVAVLDTGIDTGHPDLAGQIDGTASFVPDEAITDINGHGTHVASTIVGTGAASGGDNKGVAPGADLIVGKVLGGPDGFGQDSWVMAGMQWAAESGADIVSMSLGDSIPSDGTDPMSQLVDSLTAQYGTLFVIAAGNAGPESISTPGAAASALTVGAVDKQDGLAWFSSTGPLAVSGALKPDITAPGVDITAARSQQMPEGQGWYRTISGTSMATPHVSGAAAILAQQHPDWTGAQLKEQLMSSAKGLADHSPYEVGTGRLDIAAAVQNPLRGTGSLFFGNYDWPHEPADTAVTKDLTFTNTGATPVTLNLAATNDNGPFTLAATAVTVPARGTAKVAVTGDVRKVGPGRHVGYVIGTDSATGLPLTRTSLGLVKEEARHNMRIKLIGRDGKPAKAWVSVSVAGDAMPWSIFVEGEHTMRVPPGTYMVSSFAGVNGERPDRSGLAAMVDPETVLDRDREVVLDARKARLLKTEAPQRSQDRQRKLDLSIVDKFGVEVRAVYAVPDAYDDLYVLPTERPTQSTFMFTTRWRKGELPLSLSTPGAGLSFDTLVQPGSTLGTSTSLLKVAYAGKGTPAEFRSAAGKIAVVERSDAVTPQERAAAAVQAGVKALIVVNDGVGGLMEYVGEVPIPVATVHRDTGRLLIALAKTRLAGLRLQQARYTSFVYDLARDYPGQVPDRELVYKPSHRDLARIDANYYGVRDGESSGYRYDLTLSPSLGFHEREWHPGTRVEWVTPGQVWVESHAQNIHGELPWEMISGVNTYQAGRTTRLDWFRPVTRPGFSDSFGVYNSRWQDIMTWNVQDWSSTSDVMRLGGHLPWGSTPINLKVFQGETLIHENQLGSDMQWKEVPAGNLPYRVVLDAQRPADPFRLSTRTHTEWTFMSGTVDAEDFAPFPVMELDYLLDTDLRGDVVGGADQVMAIRSGSSNFDALPGRVTSMTLEISGDDGATWQRVHLRQGAGGWWNGSFKAPKRPGGFLSVRASAVMDSGYSIKQEIIRGYGLR